MGWREIDEKPTICLLLRGAARPALARIGGALPVD
jgi:hypothetical protein